MLEPLEKNDVPTVGYTYSVYPSIKGTLCISLAFTVIKKKKVISLNELACAD